MTALFRLILILLALSAPAHAARYELVIDQNTAGTGITINGQSPGPALRFTEGEQVTIAVENRLDTDTSLHWHGLLVPQDMDGVPGVSFDGIGPGETFTYSYRVKQAGTYWYHSHSGLQEQAGAYGPLVITPRVTGPARADREVTILLSDWLSEPPEDALKHLKKRGDYYNYHQRTLGDLIADIREKGAAETLAERAAWGRMRMSPNDISDIGGYTFLMNGKTPEQNFTSLFTPGERIRIRFINGAAMSYFDVSIPGLKMTVVQADGQDVMPVTTDEIRIAVAETYDVIVTPSEDRPYAIFAEALDRSGHASGTLATQPGQRAPLPAPRPRPQRTMADMMGHGMEGMANMADTNTMGGMEGMAGMDGAKHDMAAAPEHVTATAHMDHSGHHMPPADLGLPVPETVPKATHRLAYTDLTGRLPNHDWRTPTRTIPIRLTGNMERYYWGINGEKFAGSEPIRVTQGERVRLRFINETMMEHPMHLHGMWMAFPNGRGVHNPRKHTISIAPGETLEVDVTVDAPVGEWAMHCHLLYHMATGMFATVLVEPPS